MFLKIRFEHPETKIIIVGEWDERKETVLLVVEDLD